MKKILLSTMAVVTLATSSAWAQFPGEYRRQPDRRGPPLVEYYERDPYQEHRRGPPPVEYYERDPYQGHRRGPPPPMEKYRVPPPGRDMDRRGPPRPRICVTSRGNCPADPRMFIGDNCSCSLPGFGMKRGNIR